jgi:hypothetical protein
VNYLRYLDLAEQWASTTCSSTTLRSVLGRIRFGPLDWHSDRGKSPCFEGLDALFLVNRPDGGGVVFHGVVLRT